MATTKRQKRNMSTSSTHIKNEIITSTTISSNGRRRSPRLMNNINTFSTAITSTSLASTSNGNDNGNDFQTKTKKNTPTKKNPKRLASSNTTTSSRAKSSTRKSNKKQKIDPESSSNIKHEEEEKGKGIDIDNSNAEEKKDDSFDATSKPTTATTKAETQSNHLPSNDINTPLLDLGTLVKGILVKRPSATVRSPYVADVRLINETNNQDEEEEEEVIVQAHSPALDVGGLCSVGATVYMSVRPPGGKTSHSIELLQAPGPNGDSTSSSSSSSSSSDDDDDYVLVGCHPNLGEKLAEEVLKRGLLQPSLGFGVAELVKPEKKKKTTATKTTTNTTKSKKKKKDNDQSNDNNDNKDEHDNQNIVKEDDNITRLYKQRTYGDSRIDFELIKEGSIDSDTTESSENADTHKTKLQRRRALIEVKNVVCSDYSAQFAPIKTGPNHCVIIAPETIIQKNEDDEDKKSNTEMNDELIPYQRSGIFPWGRVGQTFEGKKVVSERAIKHLRNLAMLNSKKTEDTKQQNEQGNDDGKEEKHCQTVVLFVLNRSDCVRMRACHEACSVFANELKAAHDKGTLVLCFRTRWTGDGKAYFDGIVPVSV